MFDIERCEKFERKLRHIIRLALAAALLHRATAWLGAGVLTWATVVLMGGFASQVSISDFELITGLVVLIASLLALSLFSTKLVTMKTLFTGSVYAPHLTYTDNRRFVVTLIELVSLLFQLLLVSPCLWAGYTSIRRPDFQSMHYSSFYRRYTAQLPAAASSSSSVAAAASNPAAPQLQACLQTCFSAYNYSSAAAALCAQSCALSVCAANYNMTANNNLQVCLLSFFLLVILTSCCATFCLIYRWMVKPVLWRLYVGDHNCLSLTRYHDEVLSRALNLGLVEADEFDAREFLLRGLGEDLMMRNIGPLEVKRQNLEAIQYLYNHPKGLEMVYEGLASENTLLQQAAANIVGFWAGTIRLDGHLELLCRMAEKLGLPGKTAEGAANSFSALAISCKNNNPSPLLSVLVARGGGAAAAALGYNVVDRDLVLQRWAPTLFVYVRALDGFFMSASIREHVRQTQQDRLEDKLMKIIDKKRDPQYRPTSGTRPRTRFIAFSALYRLRSADGTRPLEEEDKESMKNLLELLDGELKEQKIMWAEEETRYRELCQQLSKNPVSWLLNCKVTGKNLIVAPQT